METPIPTYAADFESFYDKECSIRTLGPLGYFSHPSFDAYMISVVGDNGYSFVGHPKDFDWDVLVGCDVLSHNASFDETLYLYGVTQRWWPEVTYRNWYCTADMAAACGLPRSLKNATAQAYNLEVSKTTRDNMSGKTCESMDEDFRKEVAEYALKDSELCLRLWQDYNDKWPQFERDISRMNRTMVQRGLPIDTDLLAKNLQAVKERLFECEQNIPWGGERPLLSRKAFDEECLKLGIEPPASLAQTDADAQDWIRRHGSKHKFIEAVTNWRRINSLMKKLESFDAATMPDNRYYGGVMYFGGHTGRFSGSGGNLNLQNLPREEMFGANLRHMIAAPKGRKLVVADLSQIEVRTLCWLAGDKETLKEIEASDDIYEAFAIRFGLWPKDSDKPLRSDPALRHKVKALVLGCGYGCGAKKFSQIFDMPLDEAVESVKLYRSRLKKVPAFWRQLDVDMQSAYDIGVPFQIELPSGRKLDYGRTRLSKVESFGKMRTQHTAIMNRNGKRLPMKLWGGIIAENCLSGDTLVVTDSGLKPLQDVVISDKVWDGVEWVTHNGTIHKGNKPTIDCHGVRATYDHKFLSTNDKWHEAKEACNMPISMFSFPHAKERNNSRSFWGGARTVENNYIAQHPDPTQRRSKTRLGCALQVWEKLRQRVGRHQNSKGVWSRVPAHKESAIPIQSNTWEILPQAVHSLEVDAGQMSTTNTSGLEKLRRAWDLCVQKMAGIISEFLGRHVPEMACGITTGSGGQQRRLYSGELQVGNGQRKRQQYSEISNPYGSCRHRQKERDWSVDPVLQNKQGPIHGGSGDTKAGCNEAVYDLKDCGPRNRFAVVNANGDTLIAHNCSQAMARDVLCYMMLKIEKAGIPIILHVHDEVVAECDESDAEEVLATMTRIMSEAPEWCADLPLDSEGYISQHYKK